jgi:rRNA maturation endonuclease Nob1
MASRKGKKSRSSVADWAWRCQECGHRFPSAAAAERAAFGDDGCPGCGGSDIDESLRLAAIRAAEAETAELVARR